MIRIGITTGDPAGVGPEVLLQALGDEDIRDQVQPLVFGDRSLLQHLAGRFGWKTDFDFGKVGPTQPSSRVVGQFSLEGAGASIGYLQAAADALESGEIKALVTGPIHKRALKVCHAPGPGQTEWLAFRFRVPRAVMMLSGPRLKVVLATTHVALRELPRVLNQFELVHTIALAYAELGHFFFPGGPRLAVAALNPHGEVNGEPGLEEREIILPAVEELQRRGLDVVGPLPGDSVFALAASGRYDAVVALYHDQGLAPLKVLHFSEAVNVTLGLGVIRTSPGHGVAYDIAHRGVADPTGMQEAIRVAAKMADRCAPQ